MSDARPLGILTPLLIEGRAVCRVLGLRPARVSAASRGRIDGIEVEVHVIGIRGIGLRSIEPGRFSVVILAGLAGGLSRSLRIGDVLVDRPGSPRRIVSSSTILATARDKADLARRSGAEAVEMEAEALLAWARRADLNLWHLRAISDTSDEAVDPRILDLTDAGGRLRLARICKYALTGGMGDLWRLARQSRIACARLGEATRELVREISAIE